MMYSISKFYGKSGNFFDSAPVHDDPVPLLAGVRRSIQKVCRHPCNSLPLHSYRVHAGKQVSPFLDRSSGPRLPCDMPSEGDIDDDDYVAKLLAEDAKRTSHKYAAQGLSAFLPKRRAADVPKPNTKFLSHIVREADHHNAALKKKEEQESERRLQALQDNVEPLRKRRRVDEPDQAKRSRMLKEILGAVQSDRRVKDRSAVADRSHSSRDHRRRHADEPKHSRSNLSRERHSSLHSSRRSRRRRKSSSISESESGPDRRKRNKFSSPADGSDADAKTHSQQRRHHWETASHNHSERDGAADPAKQEVKEAVPKRGRGAHRAKSGIDDRFAKDYDPSQDVVLDSDHDGEAEDWDLALEAMRDRVKWKQNQASRMREAGFGESEITQWEKGSKDRSCEGDPSRVQWSRRGEVREWDAGKTK